MKMFSLQAGSILEGDFIYRIDPIEEVTEDMEKPIVVSRGHFKQPYNDLIGGYLCKLTLLSLLRKTTPSSMAASRSR